MPGREGGPGGVSGRDRSHVSAQKLSPCCGWELGGLEGVTPVECILPMETGARLAVASSGAALSKELRRKPLCDGAVAGWGDIRNLLFPSSNKGVSL